jgi:hypothetical protein
VFFVDGKEMSKKKKCYEVKGVLVTKEKDPVKGVTIKAYDKAGVFLGAGSSDKKGGFAFETEQEPATVKFVYAGFITGVVKVEAVGALVDLGSIFHCFLISARWHITGEVIEKATGRPLSGLTIEAFDVDDETQGGPYYDPLGEAITSSTGRFDIWFNDSDFNRDESILETYMGNPMPDILIKVKNDRGVVIHETEIDRDVSGLSHDCGSFCIHKGKEYTIEIDQVTLGITKLGPVPIGDIDNLGFAAYGNISDRPFGGKTTVHGRIWGANVERWRLSYADGFVDSQDERIGTSGADPFNTIHEDTTKVWDGPIHKWNTGNLEGTKTLILVVWDNQGNAHSDTQVIFLHNEAINPPAQITSPAAGGVISKSAGTDVDIEGTANDINHFLSFSLHWAGCAQTELTTAGIQYPVAGNTVPVVGGKLGTWDISGLPEGPYVVRLRVSDKVLVNDGVSNHVDHTWHTLNIVA